MREPLQEIKKEVQNNFFSFFFNLILINYLLLLI